MHGAILAQSECVAQVFHALLSIELRLSLSGNSTSQVLLNRNAASPGDNLCQCLTLVIASLPMAGGMQRHRDDSIDQGSPFVFEAIHEEISEDMAQIVMPGILEPVNQISEKTGGLVGRDGTIEPYVSIFTARTAEF